MDIEEKMEVDVVTSFVMVKCEPQLNEDSNISEPEAAMPVKVKQSEFKQDDELQPWDLSTVKQEQQEEEGVGLQRCVMQCNDEIRDKIGPNSTDAEMSQHTLAFERCAAKCVDSHLGLIPTIMKKMSEVLSQGKYQKQ
ncbi:protein FAM136A isoform X4 [Periplaneta americana]|uniref:protein FAM136A isoform X4 n=1 Tax=Periplaneta americana TaxID=6978 RepID=UPI0037E8923A